MKCVDRLTDYIALLKSFQRQRKQNDGGNVRYYNWWKDPYSDWFGEFIRKRHILRGKNVLNFFSVFGNKEIMKFAKGRRIFFSGENLHRSEYAPYRDYCLEDGLSDFSMGFDYVKNDNYLRFPLWIIYTFKPGLSSDEIKKRCAQLRYPSMGERTRFASMIARYDWGGIRSGMCNELNKIDKVSCPSVVLHNDDTLKTDFLDDKIQYLRQFFFNICPENSDCEGYVTEKIFEAIDAGCIPIYWGSRNAPENEVLNKDAIIFWDVDGENKKSMDDIRYLYLHPKALNDFMKQPRLLPSAEEYILHILSELADKLNKMA